jgi:hypothetical protein
MRLHPLRAAGLTLALLVLGCDSNPDGPSGPASPTAADSQGAPAAATPPASKSVRPVNDMTGSKVE